MFASVTFSFISSVTAMETCQPQKWQTLSVFATKPGNHIPNLGVLKRVKYETTVYLSWNILVPLFGLICQFSNWMFHLWFSTYLQPHLMESINLDLLYEGSSRICIKVILTARSGTLTVRQHTNRETHGETVTQTVKPWHKRWNCESLLL